MKLRYACLFSLSALAQFTWAQGVVTLRDENNNIVNGTLISGPCFSSIDTVSLLSTLNGSVARTVNVRRYEMWPVANSKNFFCWGVCYLPVYSGVHYTWVSNDPVAMNPGVSYDNFHSYYQPMGQTGTARFRFVWYDTSTPTAGDSTWVDIDYCGQVGVQEQNGLLNSLRAWPQPSAGQDVQLEYSIDGSGANAQLVLYTILGERLRSQRLASTFGRIALPTAELSPGVYFANIEREGRVLSTVRLVVTR